jgi:hypothetical protein
MVKFFIGLDLGQADDFTALCVLEMTTDENVRNYAVRRLERIRGASYPDIVIKIAALLKAPPLAGNSNLVLDQTGCGRPIFDMFVKAGLKPTGISIHGGDAVSHEGNSWRVPKRDLVGILQVLLQTNRLKVASKLKLGPVLQAEMLNFRVKIDPATAHDSYSSWRESDHDDLVLSTALACWWGENRPAMTELKFSSQPLLRPYSYSSIASTRFDF